jgi:hypothetical protein
MRLHRDRIALMCLWALFTMVGKASSQEIDWGAAIQEMFNQLVQSAIPDAVAPLVTIAENADELAVDAMAIALGVAEREVLNELASSPTNKALEKRLKALQQLKAQNRRIKRTINPPHKEQDDDPFFGAMVAGMPITLPPIGSSINLQMQLDQSETDPDLTPAAYLVFSGMISELAPTELNADITIHRDDDSGRLRLEVHDFSYVLPSFEIEGFATGVTTASLDNTLGAPMGVVELVDGNSDVGLVELRLGVQLANNLYCPAGPVGPSIPGFAQVRGMLDFAAGRAVISAEDPVLTPGKPGLVQQFPMFAAPTMAVFDPAGGTVRFEDMFFDLQAGFDTGEDPRVAFIRFRDDSYGTFENSTDRILGATVSIGDLHIASQSDTTVVFDPSEIVIEDASGLLLRAPLENIVLEVLTGNFFADLDVDDPAFFADVVGSPLLAQFLAATRPQLQLLSPQAAGVLYLASEEFTVLAQSTTIDFINGMGVPEPSCLVQLAWLALLTVRRYSGARQLASARSFKS